MPQWYVEPANPIDAEELASLYRRVRLAYRGTLASVLLGHRMPEAESIYSKSRISSLETGGRGGKR